MSEDINVTDGVVLEVLNGKVDLDGGNYKGSELEAYIHEHCGGGFNIFDTKISDHILEGNEAKGWALQGTYVEKALYPDFYNKCLEQKTSAIESEVTLGSSTLTMFVHSNGHQFFNIADKNIVDTFFDTYGIADFYGIDEENERIFLPRNKYFAIKNPVKTIPVYGNGMTLGLTNGTTNAGLTSYSGFYTEGGNNRIDKYGTPVGSSVGNTTKLDNSKSLGVTQDPNKSGLIANSSNIVQPDESKYLYYCVGNTVVNEAEIDAGALASTKADVTLGNVNSIATSTGATWAMPSDKYVDLTLGANGTQYTAPANGWFSFRKRVTTGSTLEYALLSNQTLGGFCNNVTGNLNMLLGVTLPSKKGDTVLIGYTASGELSHLRFYYAVGSESEAN